MTDTAYMTTTAADLDLFSKEEDLFGPACSKTFDFASIDQTITDSAHRALLVLNAQAQLMLAQYQTGSAKHTQSVLQKAQAIAYELGEYDFNPERLRRNPFEEPVLREAWDNGNRHGRDSHEGSMYRIHAKFWDEGVDTEDSRSQFELCALQLFRLAASLESPVKASRAKRLAMEMVRYHEGETPSAKRQQEIDRFMAKQAERLALELEF